MDQHNRMNQEELELKCIALNQRISEIVGEYENKVADLRVELTFLAQKAQKLETENEQVKAVMENLRPPTSDSASQTIPGEVFVVPETEDTNPED